MLFHRQKTKWVVFLYTDKENVDVSNIAKNYGGGGHRSAAGFSAKKFPFWEE
jgi:nanoRNase/pAp phosphatase (c-di-AMP/oligoRNAs hydrolase)